MNPLRGLRQRMFAVALIPVLTIAFGAANNTVQRTADVRSSREVVRLVERLTETMSASAAISAERLPTQARQGARAFGVNPTLVGLLVGFDPDTRLRQARPTTDHVLVAPRFAAARSMLAVLRKQADDGAPIEEINSGWDELGVLIGTIKSEDLEGLRIVMERTHRLEPELAVLLASEELVDAVSAQTTTTFQLRSGDTERRDLRAILATSERRIDDSMRTLRNRSGPATSEVVAAMVADPSWARSKADIAETLDNPTRSLIKELTRSAASFTALTKRGTLAAKVNLTAVEEMGAEAARARQAAQQSWLLTSIWAAAIVLASLGTALFAARSILRPLQALAERAKGVAAGRLDDGQLAEAGPVEVVLVSRAFNDLVANLGILDRQVLALAEGDLAAEALQQELPGDLGIAIRRTVNQLSHSVRVRDEMEDRLAYEASHDQLTGLSNRHAVMRSIEAALRRSTHSTSTVACLFIDLDGFKRANDFYGHRFGDDVLRQCAERLQTLGRFVLDIGRLGGDEFIVVAQDLPGAGDAVTIAERIVHLLADQFIIDGKVCQIGGSVGVAIAGVDSTSSSLVRDADMAVYRAKQRGGGVVEVFDALLRAEMQHRSEIESAFQQALTDDELWLAYQPIVERRDGAGNELVALEALVRWDRPGVGPISPADFVPVLEKGPYITDLSRYVLKRALRELAEMQRHPGLEHLSVNVNLSVRDLAVDGLVDEVIEEINRAHIQPGSLVIEITETALLTDVAVATDHLRQLRAAGVRIALDDFGTGFTSISQLALLPIDIMKIDRSFTVLVTDPERRAIVEMMIGVGRTLGLTVVAEGVETDEEAALLVGLGCTRQQGWAHGRPVAPDKLAPMTL